MNQSIVANATKYTDCHTCGVAYTVLHQGNQDCVVLSPNELISRIHVTKDHSQTTVVACHQCEGAPCANVCPVDTISHEHRHISAEQPRCTGCKSCILAYPFGVMEVAPSRKRARTIECDPCWYRTTGPACAETCLTRALQCIDVEKM